jgi:hypothetical protein
MREIGATHEREVEVGHEGEVEGKHERDRGNTPSWPRLVFKQCCHEVAERMRERVMLPHAAVAVHCNLHRHELG